MYRGRSLTMGLSWVEVMDPEGLSLRVCHRGPSQPGEVLRYGGEVLSKVQHIDHAVVVGSHHVHFESGHGFCKS